MKRILITIWAALVALDACVVHLCQPGLAWNNYLTSCAIFAAIVAVACLMVPHIWRQRYRRIIFRVFAWPVVVALTAYVIHQSQPRLAWEDYLKALLFWAALWAVLNGAIITIIVVVSNPWYSLGLIIRLFRLNRLVWIWRLSSQPPPKNWKEGLGKVKSQAAFFDAVLYRAPCHRSFDKEQDLIGWALHTKTYHYFRGERALGAYKRVVQSVGTYLEHARKTNSAQITSSAVWRDYLHSKATLEQISGRPDVAASLNSEAKTLFPSEPLESLQYEGCTMCCRLETLTNGEDYLLTKIDEQLGSLIVEFRKSLSASGQPQDPDINTKIFYVAILRCKAQARRNKPDLTVMKQAIEIAEESGRYITGLEKETYDVTTNFYKAFVSEGEKRPQTETEDLYRKALTASRKVNVPYFCLLRVPEDIFVRLATLTRMERINPNKSLEKLKCTKTGQFCVILTVVIFLALILPIVLHRLQWFRGLVASVKQGSIVWFLGAYACSFWLAWLIISGLKFVSDRRDSGMVSPKIMSAADWAMKIFSGLALALTIAWIKQTGIP